MFPQPMALGAAPAGLGFTHATIDRAALIRADDGRLAAARAAPAARFAALCGEFAVLARGEDGQVAFFDRTTLDRLPRPREEVFLGLQTFGPGEPAVVGGAPRFAVLLDDGEEERLREAGEGADAPFALAHLRALTLAGAFDAATLSDLSTARAMLGWHRKHRFCAHCGTPTAPALAGWRRDCAACGTQHFPRTDPVVIMMVVDGDECLLGRQPRFPQGMVSCLAGFMEPGETIEAAVRREVKEESDIDTGPVAIAANQPWPFPMSLMIGCYAQATSRAITLDPDELEMARWFSRAEVRQMLAGQHPEGFTAPLPLAIAHHLMKAWAEG